MATNRNTPKCISTILILVSFSSVLCQSKMFAQRPLRDVNGIVTDQHRLPLKGAVVKVQNMETNRIASYITGVDGRYSFKRLDEDSDYRIWAKDHLRRSKAKSLSHFNADQTKTINFTITFQ